MPIIIDHTPGSARVLSGFAQGYAQNVLQRQREDRGLADQLALDTSRTDNNIRQSQAAADFELANAPARTEAEVARARAMQPVAMEGYKARATFDQQQKEGADDRQRQMRSAVFDKTFGEMTKGGMPPHVQPWMVALARADFADGKLDKGTYDLLRPRTPRELADEKYVDAERAAKLRAAERADAAPADAARFYRELRGAGGQAGPVDPQDDLIARGLESGAFKLNDPAVRGRLNLLTPGESTAQARATGAGGAETRLSETALRLRVDAEPEVVAASLRVRSANRVLERLEADPLSLDEEKIAAAEARLHEAEKAFAAARQAAQARLSGDEGGGGGVRPPGTGSDVQDQLERFLGPGKLNPPSQPPAGLDEAGLLAWKAAHGVR